MRTLFAALLIACAALVLGCGHSSPHGSPYRAVPQPGSPFVCVHKVPAQMGECVRQELQTGGRTIEPQATPPPPNVGASFRTQGIDISRWQPHPDFRELYREGIRFVIIQGADNDHASNPFFDSQVRSAHEAGMKIGVYVFTEGAFGTYQADALIAAARSERSRIELGAFVDAEVPSAYSQACRVAAALSHSFNVVGVYGSPGTYRGGRCVGYVWPAEWSTASPYPLSGYPFSAIALRQWCGTCRLSGNDGEIDRDEDRGLLELVKPPAPPKPKRSLKQAYTVRRELRADLTRHHCRQPPWHVAVGLSGRPNGHYEHSCHVWLSEGRDINKEIKAKGGH